MKGYFLSIANKLQLIRYGKTKSLKICDFSELETWPFWKAVFAEFFGTLLFIFLGTQSTIPLDGAPQLITKVSFAFGLGLLAISQVIGPISGGHVNPAASLSLAVVGLITHVRAFFYVIAQTVGGITGSFILKGVTASTFHNNLGLNVINPQLTVGQGLGIEIIMTFTLVFVVMATTDPDRTDGGNTAVAVGLTVAGLNLTGVFWVAPIVGGIVASLSYTFVFSPYKQPLYHGYKIPSIDEATSRLLHHDGPIVVPKNYFKEH